jgi:predicted nucleic acid-binding protein
MAVSRIFWDTNLFIYLFEDRGERGNRVAELRRRMLERHDELVTSALTLAEILVKPMRLGREDLCQQYEQSIARGAVVVSFDPSVARKYAEVRKDPAVKAPDAFQLACAATARVDLFITNDDRLSRKAVPGIDFVVSLDAAPL